MYAPDCPQWLFCDEWDSIIGFVENYWGTWGQNLRDYVGLEVVIKYIAKNFTKSFVFNVKQ